MRHLHIDIETKCEKDIGKVGAHRYAEDPTFSIILFAYSWDDGEICVVDTSGDSYPGESLPDDVREALSDPDVLKIAHNANFEFTCIRAFFGIKLDIREWFCTMVASAYMGLPMSLDKVGQVLGLTDKKDAGGKALITYFCKPCRPTKTNGGRTWNLPEHAPDKWEAFKLYNAQDVRTEKALFDYLSRFPGLPPTEWEYWRLDQHINATGISIDQQFIRAALETNNAVTNQARAEIISLTGIDNPKSLPQLKAWLFKELGYQIHSLDKNYVSDAIEGGMLPEHVARVMKLRQLTANTSVSKYESFLNYVCLDGRIRGLLQFYGAGRTGRFSGRGPQIHNLKRTPKTGIDVAREAVLHDLAGVLYDDVPSIISKLTRTALVAAEGHSLVVSDFSAIEARVLAWEAGEDWILDVFRSHGKIYEATASNMFGVPIEMIDKGSDLRAKGKVAVLALGYQGGEGALVAMGALREGIDEAELPAIVKNWRAANPLIVKFWKEVENAAKHVVANKTSYVLRKKYCKIKFIYDRGYLFIELPSGRRLAYYGAAVEKGRLVYWGINQVRKSWERSDTYGGSLVENITQAVARDCLCEALYLIYYKEGLSVLMHVHDEIICEAPDAEASGALAAMNEVMRSSPEWAKDLPLRGEGYISKYYKKD